MASPKDTCTAVTSRPICGNSGNTPLFCFKKLVSITVKDTTRPPMSCISGCECLSMDEGKGKSLPYCRDTQIVCGYRGDTPLYCFALPTTDYDKTDRPHE